MRKMSRIDGEVLTRPALSILVTTDADLEKKDRSRQAYHVVTYFVLKQAVPHWKRKAKRFKAPQLPWRATAAVYECDFSQQYTCTLSLKQNPDLAAQKVALSVVCSKFVSLIL